VYHGCSFKYDQMLPKGRLRLSVRRTRTRKISTTRCFQKHRIFCRVGWKEEHNYKCYQVLPKGRIFLSDRKTNRRKLQVQSVALKGQASPVGSNGKKRKITNTTRWIRWINVRENWRDNQEWTTRNTSNSRHTRHSEKKTEGTIKNGQQETLATVDTQDTRWRQT
jgi:hypothetical protein